MAKIDDFVDSGRGQLGNLVLYKMNGKNYVRTKPAKYKDRKSPAQLAQRMKLQVVNSFLRPFREIVKLTYASEAVGRSALQAVQSNIMQDAMTGEYPEIYVDHRKVLLSKGPLKLPVSASVDVKPDGLLVKWVNEPFSARNAGSDTLIVIALWEKEEKSEYAFTTTKRSVGEFHWKISMSGTFDNSPQVWIAFQNVKKNEMSDSMLLIP